MKYKLLFLVLAIHFLAITGSFARLRKANRCFELYNYSKAIPFYKKAAVHGNDQEKQEAVFRLADCYRLTNNIEEARSWYSRGIELYQPEPVHYLYLGQALQSLGQYEEAEKIFIKYSDLNPEDKRGLIYARYCREIQELPILDDTVEIQNASSLNSIFSDFGPVFYKDGLIIASDRTSPLYDENIYEWTNYGYLDLYFSSPGDFRDFWSQLSEPARMSEVFNQTWHDGPVCFSSDFTSIYLTRTQKNKGKKDESNFRTSNLKIYYASIAAGNKIKYESFPYNSERYSVGHPTVSKDGKRLIFSSDMPGGYGGSDLYLTENSGGSWSPPVNLGPEVNSFGNEVFPFWANDSVLYFSSDGHMGYGGLDIYEARWSGNKWNSPENMLKPVNSPFDDFGLTFHSEVKIGFFSSNRPGGKGADDIYAIRNYTKKPAREKVPAETDNRLASSSKSCGSIKEKEAVPSASTAEKKSRETMVSTPDPLPGNTPVSETFYTIQVMAAVNPVTINKENFQGEEDIFEKKIIPYYKYFAGRFNTYSSAVNKRNQLKSKFPGCFITGFRDGKLIPLSEMKQILD